MNNKYTVLKKYFGYSALKPGQEEVTDSILSGRDCFAVMPTGAGKSLCFQLPALMMSGITLVISPLISLMKDQVAGLCQSGIRAAYLNSSLTYPQYKKALANAMAGEYKIIYTTPERLMSADMTELARRVDISMVTIDEAHCVSQWGHDFRPHYKDIPEFIENIYPRPVVSAFTATATPEVKTDILKLLRLKDPFMITTGYDRENLFFEVRHPENKFRELSSFLKSAGSGSSGIIYCSTRSNVDKLYDKLSQAGASVVRYHAGLEDDERKSNQEAFRVGSADIMVATNAFGMGIDKPDISFVIHYNMPADMESYYQEAGRAGRDGSPAKCILMFSAGDIYTNKYLIKTRDMQDVDEQTAALLRQRAQDRLGKMTSYCRTQSCLRAYILEYFGERPSPVCDNCGNCTCEFETVDITREALCILRFIKNTGERYGAKAISDGVRGSKNEMTQKRGFEYRPGYGSLRALSERRTARIFDELISSGYITVSEDEYSVLSLTDMGRALTDGSGEAVKMRVNKTELSSQKSIQAADPELFEALRAERARLAARRGVPAFVIFSDATLRDMCEKLPRNEQEFLNVSGVGYTKMKNYAKYFLKVINAK